MEGSRDVEAITLEALPSGPTERFAYSYAVRVGRTLHISGAVSFDASGAIVGENDVEAQATQIFENLAAVLAAAGGTLDDVVSTTTFMTDPSQSLAINEVRRRYITGPVKPTSTLLVVAALARPEFLLEIAAVAELRA